MKSKIFCLFITIVASLNIYAYDYMYRKVKVGDFYYELDKDYKTATVTNSITKTLGEQSYCGEMKIPSAIMYEGEIYEVTEIDLMAFQYSKRLYSIKIPNTVKRIGAHAFDGCSSMVSVELPQNLKRIEEGTFDGCLRLTSIQIGDKVQYIGREAFSFCRSLKTLIVPSTVKKIEYNAFYEVNNVIYKGKAEGAPWGANNINKASNGYLVFADNNKTILASCAQSASGRIIIPEGVTRISANAFKQCTKITAISIPSTLKYIEYGAFVGCTDLEFLAIPKSVQTVEAEAFRNCKNLNLKIPEKFRGELGTLNCKSITYY